MTSFNVTQIVCFSILLGFLNPYAAAADIEAGKKKAAMCVGCHGKSGVSKNPMFPNLAGQINAYIENQLKAFKSGKRTSPIMENQASGLNKKDMQNLAAFFSSQEPNSAGGDSKLAKQGKDKTAMCLGCHGKNAQGQGQYPRLAGQHPKYLTKQLIAFKNGARIGGPMAAITKNLSEQDINEITAYLGSL